jgi:hypothetical protein
MRGPGPLLALALAAAALVGCGGDDEEPQGGGSGGDAGAEVFPEGGRVPEGTRLALEDVERATGCELLNVKGSGYGKHTTTLDERVGYGTNPPTAGRHYQIPAEDGLYMEAAPDEALVHSMEHGRVIVWAEPDLPREARATLRAFFEEDDYQLLLTPRADMPYAVAATAWNGEPQPDGTGRTLGCPEWSGEVVSALRAFRDEHRGRGPEPVP